MSEVTIEAIGKLLESKFDEKLEPLNTKLDAIQETVASHTASLDAIAKDVKDLNEKMSVANHRADKHEQAIKFTAEKIGVAEEIKKIIQA